MKRAPSLDRSALEQQERLLDDARGKRRVAVWRLLESISELPIEEKLEQVAKDLTWRKPDGS